MTPSEMIKFLSTFSLEEKLGLGFLSTFSFEDKFALFVVNGTNLSLAVIFSEAGPAWITAICTGFYLLCKGIAALRASRTAKKESKIDSEKDL